MLDNCWPLPPWIIRWWKADRLHRREMKLHEKLDAGDGTEKGWNE